MTHAPPGPADPIDRVSPTRRPAGRAVMRQDWHHLLFLHWAVPADDLRRLLPPGLELDLYRGSAYVGLVAFTMSGIRPVGLPPLPWLSRFHETNVRTYVHAQGRDPGVWFFSLDAANPVAVAAARAWFHLPYFYARMRLTCDSPEPEMISYSSERVRRGDSPASTAIVARPRGSATTAVAGTLEHFLVERYILYASHRGRLDLGRVHHAPYPIQGAEIHSLDESLIAAAGLRRPSEAPLAHYAHGVRVEVFPLRRAALDPRC